MHIQKLVLIVSLLLMALAPASAQTKDPEAFRKRLAQIQEEQRQKMLQRMDYVRLNLKQVHEDMQDVVQEYKSQYPKTSAALFFKKQTEEIGKRLEVLSQLMVKLRKSEDIKSLRAYQKTVMEIVDMHNQIMKPVDTSKVKATISRQ